MECFLARLLAAICEFLQKHSLPLYHELPRVSTRSTRACAYAPRYLTSLKTSAILRLLRQLSEAYSVMSVSSLAAMVPFASFGEVEAVVVEAVKYDYLQVRIAVCL